MRRIRVLIGTLLLASVGIAIAQDEEPATPLSADEASESTPIADDALTPEVSADDERAISLFADDTPLELTIEGPFRQLSRDGRERPERSSLVRYIDEQGEEVTLDVDVRIRGNSRLEICAFPPLRLDFPRSQLEGTVFAGQNQLKLVTLCRQQDTYRDYLVQEYQIYLAFNALTDRSFRVRRATVQYVETEGRRPRSFTEEAFLIEEDWEVAERHGMEVLEVGSLEPADLNPRHTTLLAVFNFMIGNTDWSAIRAVPGEDCCHNGAVLHDEDEGTFVIPYDFDQAGVINTSYAEPNPVLRINSVLRRLYRGLCSMNGELELVVDRFNEQRAVIEGVFDAERVRERQRNRALDYLRGFYEIINDAEQFNEDIVEACRS